MSHLTPWQLELHALGEHDPAVAEHLPCPVCEASLALLLLDPGAPPPQPPQPPSPSPVPKLAVAAGMTVIASLFVLLTALGLVAAMQERQVAAPDDSPGPVEPAPPPRPPPLPVPSPPLHQASAPVGLPPTRNALETVLARIEPLRADRIGYKPVVLTAEERRRAATAIQSGSRDGASWGAGVLKAPIDRLWAALNDEIGQAQGQYTAVVHSEIVVGERCKPGRQVLQMIDIPVPFVSGKWWIGMPTANARLHRNSGGRVRELKFDSSVNSALIMNPASLKLANARSPIVFTNGAWFLVEVDAQHTYVEYHSRSDPGGGIPKSMARGLAANAIKSNFEAMQKFATQGTPHCLRQAPRVASPAWSVSGDYLAYEQYDGAHSSLRVLTVASQTTEPVTLPGSTAFGPKTRALAPVWHPAEIMVFEGAVGGQPDQLMFFQPGMAAANRMIPLPGEQTSAAIQPDGSRMAFIDASGDLMVRDSNTTRVTPVTSTPAPEASPAFATPPPKTGWFESTKHADLAYTRADHGQHDIYVYADGRESAVVTGPEDQIRPAYAGDILVYFESSGSGWDLVSWDGARHVLASNVRLPLRAAPAVSPNGRWVAYTVEDHTAAGSVHLVRPDGSEHRTVPTGWSEVAEPALGPQGRLAFTGLRPGTSTREVHVHAKTIELE